MTTTEVSFADKCTLRLIYHGQGQGEGWVSSVRLVRPDVKHLVEGGFLERLVADDEEMYRITKSGINAIADDLTHDRVTRIAFRVAEATHHQIHWVARQQDSDGAYMGWAFAVGSKAPFFSNEDLATRTDEELYVQAFTEAMGYPPGGAEDLQAQIDRNVARRGDREAQVNDLLEEIALLDDHINGLRQQLAEARACP